ncbi:gibberellin-regulated protein 1-like [Lycium barbarum]|uniref:gibberellin-regulated protein 1-like n=1 Tax=Lycium barbarum TaxID=112863 RepID=UPI00293E2C4D|nr:gibberellin-regulated protein 1-like [Lycium barbarum]XP_060173500.1 gibberellin-regulated protein 1-like [Lycium barbarum]
MNGIKFQIRCKQYYSASTRALIDMAISKLLLAAMVFISLLLVQLVEADNQVVNTHATESSYTPKLDCGAACEARCRLASRQKMCKRACGTCCARCNCVPPGTSGNQELCPCYYNMTTHGGRRKCP